MNFYALSGLLNGFAAIISGLLVYLRAPKDPKHRAYGLFCLSASIWGFFYFAWQLTETYDLSLLFARLLMAGAIFLPITYLYHVLTLLDLTHRHARVLQVGWTLSVLFLLADLTPFFVSDVRPIFSFQYWPQPGIFFHFYLVWFLSFSIYGTYLLVHAYREATGLLRNRFLLLTIGTVIAHVGGFTTFPLWYGIDFPPNGAILITVYISVVAYSLLNYRLLDFGTAVERGLTYSILMVLVALPAYPVLLLSQNMYFGDVDYTFSIIQLLLFILMVIGAYTLKIGAHNMIVRTLFKGRYDMYETLTKFSKSLLTILDLKDLTEKIVNYLSGVMGIKHAVLYLLDREKSAYAPASVYGEPLVIHSPLNLSANEALPRYLGLERTRIVREEFEQNRMDEGNQAILQNLRDLGAEICLPLINKNRLLGFCALGQRISNSVYSTQDLHLLETLAQEASIALDNALLYEELKQSQELVRRTDRLRSLETMAGGLAHEIRNPLTSIKTFVDMAPQHTSDQRFLSQFSKVVKEDVSRIERLTNEILDYARPVEPFLRVEDINDIIESCLYGLRVRPSHENIRIETVFGEDVPPVFVDRQQIKQVLLNLFLNAMEAMELEGGKLLVRTNKVTKSPGGLWAQIEVCDTGTGIAQNDLEHIFDPFYTTKHQSHDHEGTGLGLSIAYQIVREHQGFVEVTSDQNQGTTFFVSLPAHSQLHERTTQEGQTARPLPNQ